MRCFSDTDSSNRPRRLHTVVRFSLRPSLPKTTFVLLGLGLACGKDIENSERAEGGFDSGSQSATSSSSGLEAGENGDGAEDGNASGDSNPSSGTSNDPDSQDDGTPEDGSNTNSEDSDDVRFDVSVPDMGVPPIPAEYSYIWIANSEQGTVSKIDTRTLEEKGRYLTRGDALGDPSRTSVSLNGHVAVANRSGGVVKILHNGEECPEKNGQAGIQTSTDATFLGFGADECMAWYTAMDYDSQRAIAWTSGDLDPDDGEIKNEKVWVAGAKRGEDGWWGDDVDVMLLNGDSGAIEESITIPGGPPSNSHVAAYGGAVDGDNNFWFSDSGSHWIVRVAIEDMSVRTWPKATIGYGFTVDPAGQVWSCRSTMGRFDPATETWETMNYGVEKDEPIPSIGGCMADNKNRLWKSAAKATDDGGEQNYLVAIDTRTMSIVEQFEVPEHLHGISIDYDGLIWGVSIYGANAYRVDPKSGELSTFDQLVKAYTYSDMTGFALRSTSNHVD